MRKLIAALIFCCLFQGIAYSQEGSKFNFEQFTPYARGCRYFDRQEWAQALTAFDQAIQQDSNNAQAYYKRGLVHEKLNEKNKSYNDLNKACELDPSNDQYHKARDTVSYDAASEGLSDAWKMAEERDKRNAKERLSAQLPVRIVASAISALIVIGYWILFTRSRKEPNAPSTTGANIARLLALIFGVALSLFACFFVLANVGPYFVSG